MNIVKTLLAGIVGTTTMTLFSYEASRNREKQFKEPVLLHRLMKRNRRTGSEKAGAEENRLDGWLLHYATGLLFSSVYDRVWRRTKVAPSIPAGVVLGAVSGLVGNIGLDTCPEVAPRSPRSGYPGIQSSPDGSPRIVWPFCGLRLPVAGR